MITMLRFCCILSALVPAGDATDLTLPAVIAGAGVGIVIIALIARRRGTDDDRSRAPKRKGKHTG